MSRPKIVFWGSPDFAVSALAACKEHSEILGVVTQPDKARGRGHELLPTPVKAWAQKENIKVFSPKSLRKLDEEGEATVAFLQQKCDRAQNFQLLFSPQDCGYRYFSFEADQRFVDDIIQ